jgi:perosamine synthetase
MKAVLQEPSGQMLSLHEPEIGEPERKAVLDCLDSGWVSSVGKYVDKFEALVAEAFQVKRAVAVSNGTVALQTCLTLSGVRPQDEVLVPALTFVATANAVIHAGGVPHFLDSEPSTLGIDVKKLGEHFRSIAKKSPDGWLNRKTGRRFGAIVAVHCFGHPCDLDGLSDFSRSTGLPLIEDAAEALGSLYQRKPVGGVGLVSCVSFNGNKTITTGGGGAILSNDENLATLAKYLTTTAKRPHRWEFFHDQVGYNFRMPNLNAALGCAQMEGLADRLNRKRDLAKAYQLAFSGSDFFDFFDEAAGSKSNYWLNAIKLKDRSRELRDYLLDSSIDFGYGVRPLWCLMHKLPMFADMPRSDLACAEDQEDRIINLPSSPQLINRLPGGEIRK